MARSEVYSWRVSPALKASLEEAARSERRTVARLLEEIVTEHLHRVGERGGGDAVRQRRLHERAARFAGRIAGSRSGRSEAARAIVRERLRRRVRVR
jgi:hypothetical protein